MRQATNKQVVGATILKRQTPRLKSSLRKFDMCNVSFGDMLTDVVRTC